MIQNEIIEIHKEKLMYPQHICRLQLLHSIFSMNLFRSFNIQHTYNNHNIHNSLILHKQHNTIYNIAPPSSYEKTKIIIMSVHILDIFNVCEICMITHIYIYETSYPVFIICFFHIFHINWFFESLFENIFSSNKIYINM